MQVYARVLLFLSLPPFFLLPLSSPNVPHQLHRVVGIIIIKTQFFIKYLHPHHKNQNQGLSSLRSLPTLGRVRLSTFNDKIGVQCISWF